MSITYDVFEKVDLRSGTIIKAEEFTRAKKPAFKIWAAIQAGRIMLDRIHTLADEKVNFAFETTLAMSNFCHVDPKITKARIPIPFNFFMVKNC